MMELRKRIKGKKPDFVRQDSHKKGKLKPKWRRPKGSDSKMRRGLKGYRRSVRIGWGSPKDVKFLHPSGLVSKGISSVSELNSLDPKRHGIIIRSAVGLRNRLMIIEEALKKDIKILNIKEPAKYLESARKKLAEKAEARKKALAEKEKKAKKKEEKKEAKKDKPAEDLTEQEAKDKEKKEKDKLLTKPT
jgi:large subunit ribosomal protein L32e